MVAIVVLLLYSLGNDAQIVAIDVLLLYSLSFIFTMCGP